MWYYRCFHCICKLCQNLINFVSRCARSTRFFLRRAEHVLFSQKPVFLNFQIPLWVQMTDWIKIFSFPVRTTRCQSDFNSRSTKTKMDTYKPAEPRWDARLILPQPLWPPKSASYSVSGVMTSYIHKESFMLLYLSISMLCYSFSTTFQRKTL